MDTIDAAVAELAARQHGLVTAPQARSRGASVAAIRHRVARGRWVVVSTGVYRIAGAPVTWESKVLAAVLAGGPRAVASHRTAAALWGLDGCRPGIPEVTVPRGGRYRPPGVRVHESTDLALAPIRRIAGIPTTAVDRTLLDLGAVVPVERVHLALDDARRRNLTDWGALLATLFAHARRGRRGVGALRRILDEHYGEIEKTDSGFERLVATLLVQAGLPRPVLQESLAVDGRTYRIDLAYPAERVGIETDGADHLRRDRWEADHARQNAVVLSSWTILRYTWRDYRDEPDRIVREVREALRQAADRAA